MTREGHRMANVYLVNLYDANGEYVADAWTDQDLSQAANRDLVVDNGGKIYVWNQRNAQWRESAGVITLGKGEDKAEAKPVETKKAE
jgi:hypothetical protein